MSDTLPPHSVECEQGALGCCLLDLSKVADFKRAGGTQRWFYELRHVEIFRVLDEMHGNGGGDFVVAAERLRQRGKLEQVGGLAYLNELQNVPPSAANLPSYLPILEQQAKARVNKAAITRLSGLIDNPGADQSAVLSDIEQFIRTFRGSIEADSLPPISDAAALVSASMPAPQELIEGVLHKGSKLVLGGSSKSFKTWTLLDLALSVSHGAPWLSFHTSKGPVLYLNMELPDWSFRSRIAEVARAKCIDLKPGQLSVWNLRGKAASFHTLFPKIKAEIKDARHCLIVLDPIYKLYGNTDENAAGDVAALMNGIEDLSVTTGAAVAFGAHFSKGNQAGKEAIDRISGSGVFARDPDSILVLTKHETDDAFTVEATLRNFRQVSPFVVRWDFPLMRRDESLDPTKLKQAGGRPPSHTPDMLLDAIGRKRLTATEWRKLAEEDHGVSKSRFFVLLKALTDGGQVIRSAVDGKYEQIKQDSRKSQN